jgi:alpha-L-fucosidase 2
LRVSNPLAGDVPISEVSDDRKNTNPFYFLPPVKAPLLNEKANMKPVDLAKTLVYDFNTGKGKEYRMHNKD